MAKFEEVFCLIRNGASIKQSDTAKGIPITRIETISEREVNREKLGYADIFEIDKYHDFVLQDQDILMSHINSEKHLGKAAIYRKAAEETIIHGMNLLVLRVKKEILNPEYALLFFNTSLFLNQIKTITKKSVNQASFSISALKQLDIEVPTIAIQEEIVRMIGKIDKLIRCRKLQLEKLDELVKARFVEMFGDPERNPCGWPVKKLDVVVASITAGWSANGEARPKKAGEKAVLKVSAVTQGFFKPDEHKVIPADMEIKKYVYPQKGDLLFSRANTRELVGATAIIEQDYPELLLPDKLWKVLFTNEMDVYYAKHILSTQAIRKVFSSQSTGTSGSMYNVSADKFRETLIPVPPMILQRKFASFVQQTDKSKAEIKKSLEQLETLKKALMQKYF